MMEKEMSSNAFSCSSRQGFILYDLERACDYKQVWEFQKRLVELRLQNKISDSLILVEHPHVLTLGRNGHRENLLVDNLPVFEVERGGDVTYHGPGQLVVYPIVRLQDYSLGVREYVELLEKVVIDVLEQFGVKSEGRLGAETGVWVGGLRKIASVGVATSHWITFHGFALNVNTDLSYFERIRPCGFDSSVMTSMAKELGKPIQMSDVKRRIVDSFSKRFGIEIAMPDRNDFKT